MKKQLLFGAMLMGVFFTASAQDSCATAVALGVGTTTVGQINGAQEAEYTEACFTGNGIAEHVEWYSYTATANGALRINTNLPVNADGDTRIAVYTGVCGDLSCFTVADDVYYNTIDEQGTPDPNNIYLTDFSIPVQEGNTYYIAFDDIYSSDGFDVEVSFTPPTCAANSLNENWSNLANWVFGCWGAYDLNEDETTWQYSLDYNLDSADLNVDGAVFLFPGPDGPKEDLLVSNELDLIGGNEYTFTVKYNGINLVDQQQNIIEANESFTAGIFAIDGENIGLVEAIGSVEGITMDAELLNELIDNASESTFTFTPEASGMYMFGLIGDSPANTGVLGIFEIKMTGVAGVKDILASKLSVSPNPASNIVTIANNENILVNGVSIVDLNGRTVKTAKFGGVAEAQVNVSDLASGVYMMTISSDNGTVTKKIIKN